MTDGNCATVVLELSPFHRLQEAGQPDSAEARSSRRNETPELAVFYLRASKRASETGPNCIAFVSRYGDNLLKIIRWQSCFGTARNCTVTFSRNFRRRLPVTSETGLESPTGGGLIANSLPTEIR